MLFPTSLTQANLSLELDRSLFRVLGWNATCTQWEVIRENNLRMSSSVPELHIRQDVIELIAIFNIAGVPVRYQGLFLVLSKPALQLVGQFLGLGNGSIEVPSYDQVVVLPLSLERSNCKLEFPVAVDLVPWLAVVAHHGDVLPDVLREGLHQDEVLGPELGEERL